MDKRQALRELMGRKDQCPLGRLAWMDHGPVDCARKKDIEADHAVTVVQKQTGKDFMLEFC